MALNIFQIVLFFLAACSVSELPKNENKVKAPVSVYKPTDKIGSSFECRKDIYSGKKEVVCFVSSRSDLFLTTLLKEKKYFIKCSWSLEKYKSYDDSFSNGYCKLEESLGKGVLHPAYLSSRVERELSIYNARTSPVYNNYRERLLVIELPEVAELSYGVPTPGNYDRMTGIECIIAPYFDEEELKKNWADIDFNAACYMFRFI